MCAQGGNRGSFKWHAEDNKGLKSCFSFGLINISPSHHPTVPCPDCIIFSESLFELWRHCWLENLHPNVRIEVEIQIKYWMTPFNLRYLWQSTDTQLSFIETEQNVKVINTKNIKGQTAMALKVSQTKNPIIGQIQRIHRKSYQFKKHMWSSSRNATHTHYKTFWFLLSPRGFFSPPQQKTKTKKKISSSNHMHLFTSKSLSHYETTNRWGTKKGGQGRSVDTYFLQGNIRWFNVLSDFCKMNVCGIFFSFFVIIFVLPFCSVHCWL